MAARCNSVSTASTFQVLISNKIITDLNYKFPGSKEKDCKNIPVTFLNQQDSARRQNLLKSLKISEETQKGVSTWSSEGKTDYACTITAGSYEVGGHIGANFCLIFGDEIQQANSEIQQAGEIAEVNQYFMP